MISTDLCPECARPTDEHRSLDAAAPALALIAACDSSTDKTEPRWINVARVANLAEAGFLVDELVGRRHRRANLINPKISMRSPIAGR